MGKPYSVDLRKCVVAAIEGGMSRNRAAKHFGVAIRAAISWMTRVDETAVSSRVRSVATSRRAISGDYALWLSQRIKDADLTIRGLLPILPDVA